MTEIEITELPPLKPNERSLLEMHSVLNIFNVLRGELVLVGLALAQDQDLLGRALAICDRLIASLRDPTAALTTARQTESHVQAIKAEIDAVLAARPGPAGDPEIQESLANLDSVFAILRARAREILARAKAPDRWLDFSATALRQDFFAVFAAIEKNSRGRFRLLFNAALQQPPDYYVDFKIDGLEGDRVRMPAVFQDVMRDLIANARKYTPPGGRITAALHESPDALRFVVEDTGRGIPAEELTRVFEFGRRASNVADVRTMGGGFGLTKAFFVTKQFGGRFWIGSQLGVGTRIRILLPQPTAAVSSGSNSGTTPQSGGGPPPAAPSA